MSRLTAPAAEPRDTEIKSPFCWFEAAPLAELCPLYLLACRVRVTVDVSGLCYCVHGTSTERWLNSLSVVPPAENPKPLRHHRVGQNNTDHASPNTRNWTVLIFCLTVSSYGFFWWEPKSTETSSKPELDQNLSEHASLHARNSTFLISCLTVSSYGLFWWEPQSINPFTAPACKISGLKDARTRLQTVCFPVL